MKILFMAPQPFFEPRGTPINVRLMLRSLSDQGHQVDLLTYPHGADIELPGLRIIRLPNIPGVGKAPIGPSKEKIVYDIFLSMYALWLRSSKRYDAIHAVEESAFIALVLHKVFGTPFIFDMDSHMTDQLRYSKFMRVGPLLRLVEWLETSSLQSATAVITVCQYLTDVAEKLTDPKKIVQIEDIPLDLPPPPGGETPEQLRQKWSIPDDAIVALYIGNLEQYQGIDLLLEAVAEVIPKVQEVRFVIVGGNDESVAHYREMAQNLGIDSQTIFTGAQPLQLMAPWHQMGDILLSPRIEGTNTPLKIYTYLATGAPIVATDMPTHTQALNNRVAMLTLPEKMDYARGILLLLQDKALREKIGSAAKSYVNERFTYATFAKKVAEVYRTI